jgi:pimeloyl-ACP methyl ester carboxylesterase
MRLTTAWVCTVLLLGACHFVRQETAVAPAVKTIVVNGAQLSYIEEGRGETVIFLNGVGTDMRVWDAVRPYIASRYRFIAYSRRHHYPNPWPDDGSSHTFTQHVEDLAAFIRALGVQRVHLVAASLGGQVAGRMLLTHPELVATAVLNDTLLGLPVPDEHKAVVDAFFKRFQPLAQAVRARDAEQAAVAVVDWISPESGGWEGLSANRKRYYLDDARTLLLMVYESGPRPQCSDFGRVHVPVLVLGGSNASPAFRVTNEQLRTCLGRDAESAVIPGAGHFWYASHPTDGAEVILHFIASHPAAPP